MSDDYNIEIRLSSTTAERDAKRVDKTINNIGRSADSSVNSVNNLGDSLDRQMKRGANAADQTSFALSKLAQAVAAALSVQAIIQYADAFNNVQNALRQVTESEAQLTATTAELGRVAFDTRANFEATSVLYAELTRAGQALGRSNEQVIGNVQTINQLALVGGRSAQAVAGAIQQLNQAIGAGALRGQEYNSVLDGLPLLLDAVAKQLGVQRGALRGLAEEGKITTEIITAALDRYATVADQKAAKATATFSQQLEQARTKAILTVGANEALLNSVSLLGTGIVKVAENLDLIIDGLTLAAAVLGARYVGSLGAATAATIAKTVANIELVKSEAAAASAVSRRAEVEAAAAAAQLKTAQAAVTRAEASVTLIRSAQFERNVTTELTAATNALTAAQRAQTLATGQAAEAKLIAGAAAARLSAANTALATTTTIAGRAMAGLSATVAALGGPLGVVLLAATALFYFSDSADESKEKTKELQAEVDKLSQSYSNLSNNILATTVNSAYAKLFAAQEAQKAVLKEIEEAQKAESEAAASGNSVLGARVAASVKAIEVTDKQRESLEKLKKEEQEAEAQIAAVNKVFDERTNALKLTGDQTDTTTEKFKKQINELKNQQQQLLLSADAYELYIAKQKAAEAGATPAQIAAVTEEVRKLQLLRRDETLFEDLFGTGEENKAEKSILNENKLIRSALEQRVKAFNEFGTIINNVNTGEFERRKSQFEFELANQQAQQQQSFASELAQLEQRRLQLQLNDDLTYIQKTEAITALNAQEILLKQEHEAALTQIESEGNYQRFELAKALSLEQFQLSQSVTDMQLTNASTALGAISNFAKQGSALQKALFLATKGVQAVQAYNSGITAAMLARATIPYPFSEPIAAQQLLYGKLSAAAILASGVAGSFGGGGGGGLGGGGSASTPSAPSQTMPTLPQGPERPQAVDFGPVIEELKNQKGLISTDVAAALLEKIDEAYRYTGGTR